MVSCFSGGRKNLFTKIVFSVEIFLLWKYCSYVVDAEIDVEDM